MLPALRYPDAGPGYNRSDPILSQSVPIMNAALVALCLLAVGAGAEPLTPGNSIRTIQSGDRDRTYIVHVSANYDAKRPTPVVVALHGAWTNAPIMAMYSGLDSTADEHGFIVVYPNGTGPNTTTLFWNSGGWDKRVLREPTDDVAFIGQVLDDLATVANVDSKRVYATGISNGGMMCYRLAADMADRIAAIAPVAGTLCLNQCNPTRPVPVLHIHGTEDRLVPFGGTDGMLRKSAGFKSVDETIRTWVKIDGCPEKPQVESLPDKADDGTRAVEKTYGPGREGSEVILVEIEGGGHTWPGRPVFTGLLGKSSRDIDANEMIWGFFLRHPLR